MPRFAHKYRKADFKRQLSFLYKQRGMSLAEIGKIYGCSRGAIGKQMKKLGISMRSRSQARLLARKKGKFKDIPYYYINNKFFKSWSGKMAYVLGLIVTDGCISKSLHTVSLAMNERELLKKVKAAMGTNIPVRASRHQARLYEFNISRQEMVRDLLDLGLTPQKSATIEFPDVPEEYLPHFIRGVFDGDGSVTLHGSRTRKGKVLWLQAHFCSASKSFMKSLESKLRRLGMPKQNIRVGRGTNIPIYRITYGHKDSKILFEVMYRDIGNGLFLERKYTVFKRAIAYKTKSESHTCSERAPYVLQEFFRLHKLYPREYRVVELAEHVGCTTRTVFRWATGRYRVRPRYLKRITASLEYKGKY